MCCPRNPDPPITTHFSAACREKPALQQARKRGQSFPSSPCAVALHSQPAAGVTEEPNPRCQKPLRSVRAVTAAQTTLPVCRAGWVVAGPWGGRERERAAAVTALTSKQRAVAAAAGHRSLRVWHREQGQNQLPKACPGHGSTQGNARIFLQSLALLFFFMLLKIDSESLIYSVWPLIPLG